MSKLWEGGAGGAGASEVKFKPRNIQKLLVMPTVTELWSAGERMTLENGSSVFLVAH